MKRILMMVNTYYQLITAIKIRKTFFPQDWVTIMISDENKNADAVTRRTKERGVFNEVCFTRRKELLLDRSLVGIFKDCSELAFFNTNRYLEYLNQLSDPFFDELMCFNVSFDIYGLYPTLKKINPALTISMFEEGIFAYDKHLPRDGISFKTIRSFRSLRGKENPPDTIRDFYCFFPEMYEGNLSAIQIPRVASDDEIIDIIKSIFAVTEKMHDYPQKYIFFSSLLDVDGGKPIGEFKLACEIAELVGKENLLIKTHPYDYRSVYQDNGFSVDTNSALPWEVIQLSGKFEDKVFLTANSGSAVGGNLMVSNPVRTHYLYPLCDLTGNPTARKVAESIEKILTHPAMREIADRITITRSLQDIL